MDGEGVPGAPRDAVHPGGSGGGKQDGCGCPVGDPEFVVQFPGGQRLGQDSGYGYFINDVLGAGQSKDEGYACFVAPTAPGDFVMLFYNSDGSLAGQMDLGTL